MPAWSGPRTAPRRATKVGGVLRTARRYAREGTRQVTNRLRRRSFARRCRRPDQIPPGSLAVFFAAGPENVYQLEHWRGPLEQLHRTRPVFVIVNRPDTGSKVLAATSLPVAFAPGSVALEELVRTTRVPVVMYANHVELNFRMLRFASPVHVYLGHGESDKDSSVSNQNKAYDRVFVAGEAAERRIVSHLRGFDASRVRRVGRPQLDHAYAGAPDWADDGATRVLYAPTWEGDRPSMGYGSLDTHGVAMMRQLIGDPRWRVVYRPHPRSGFNSASYAAADAEIRRLLTADGDRHLVDTGEYGWQWDFADVCITDMSSVAYDWLSTGKPLVVTTPASEQAFVAESILMQQAPTIAVSGADGIADVLTALLEDPAAGGLDDSLAEHYFGVTTGGASTERFHAAVDEAIGYAADNPLPLP